MEKSDIHKELSIKTVRMSPYTGLILVNDQFRGFYNKKNFKLVLEGYDRNEKPDEDVMIIKWFHKFNNYEPFDVTFQKTFEIIVNSVESFRYGEHERKKI